MFLKFPVVHLLPNMREKIVNKATELFLSFGFKSVTMDDIATEMGISKKTIYIHFENKTKLVEATTLTVFETISQGIDNIQALEKNPIAEIYEIKYFVMDNLKDEKSSPQHQLQKYYPKLFASLKQKQFDVMQNCVVENLERGVALDLYRKSVSVEFVSRIYFSSMMSIKDQDLFPLKAFSMNMLMDHFLEYHLRGICTPKGLEILTKFITNSQS